MAEAAEVSTSIVSLVANGKDAGRVSAPTRLRVLKAIEHLGYRVDTGARALATGQRQAIALLIPDIGDPFFGQLARGVAHSLGGHYQLVLVVAGDAGTSSPRLEDVLALRVDGLLIDSTAAAILGSARPPCPVVLLDAPGVDQATASVEFDVAAGAAELVDHLMSLGHRAIGYIDWDRTSATFEVRRQTIVDRLGGPADAGTSFHLEESAISIDAARRAFEAVWGRWHPAGVTAVICATDLQAYGLLEAARALGVAIPGMVSVAAFNDLELSRVVVPSLTTVALPPFELGRSSANLLRRIIEGRPVRRHRRIRTRLVIRESTASARTVPGV